MFQPYSLLNKIYTVSYETYPVCWPIMQHGVRIEAVFVSLQYGEHMVESTCFQHTSSHPDKYNNFVDRIISKEEEREDPKRELQSIFEYRIQWSFHIIQELQCFHTQSSNSKIFLHTELILLQEFSKKYYNYKAHPVQAPSSIYSPCFQAF